MVIRLKGASIPNSLIKYTLQILLSQRRALKILVSLNFLCASQSLLVCYGLHALLPQRLESSGILTEIELSAHEDDRNVGCMVIDFGVPLVTS